MEDKYLKQTLYWVLVATRGGPMRVRILQAIKDRPMNANQLATHLGVDYRTVRHHIEVLEEHRLIEKSGEKYGALYSLPAYLSREDSLLMQLLDGKMSLVGIGRIRLDGRVRW